MAKKRSLEDMVKKIAKTPLDSFSHINNKVNKVSSKHSIGSSYSKPTSDNYLFKKARNTIFGILLTFGVGFGGVTAYNALFGGSDSNTPKKTEVVEQQKPVLNEIVQKVKPVKNISGLPETIDSNVKLVKGDYFISHRVYVNDGAVLEIEPGTILKFSLGSDLFIDGSLIARGTPSEKIVFTDFSIQWGGIIISNENVKSELDYCIISDANSGRTTGGGLSIINASPIIKHSVIENNSSDSYGGGIYFLNSGAILKDNIIQNNSAEKGGGGMYLQDSNVLLVKNKFEKNKSTYGGALFINELKPSLKNNIIRNNSASYGGGIYVYNSEAILENNFIGNNNSYAGGGSYILSSKLLLNNNTIISNVAKKGGGIYLDRSDINVLNNTIKNNKPNNIAGK